ncbi:hypothetical protein ACIP93_32910 [Streptomyces sp. NPDC088745]|uniref:hypothetical protein n=1 Tax=Streptomyces sp. NPDC088745 TaxID=3365884 RepID=UPI00380D4C56
MTATPDFATSAEEAKFWVEMGMGEMDDAHARALMTEVRNEITWGLVKLLRAHGHEAAAQLLDNTLPPPPD